MTTATTTTTAQECSHAEQVKKVFDTPVSFDANTSVARSHFQLLIKVHDHPHKGVNDVGERTTLKPAKPVIVDDNFRLAQFKLNIQKLVSGYPIKWVPNSTKQKLSQHIERYDRGLSLHLLILFIRTAQGPSGLYNPTDTIELIRLRWKDVGVTLPFHLTTKITPTRGYTDYLNTESTHRNRSGSLDKWEEWYVVFSDQNMLLYSQTDRFASEEIAAVEHPVLGSIRRR
ncbi:hypothetical protein BC829DRAFT_79801 [Chytridium lagenaria]|nr:hypothetical protein BC829DRAFT_79801 [Chytridium lagenaria]